MTQSKYRKLQRLKNERSNQSSRVRTVEVWVWVEVEVWVVVEVVVEVVVVVEVDVWVDVWVVVEVWVEVEVEVYIAITPSPEGFYLSLAFVRKGYKI